ncbi:MAG: PP2C family protein-serine/threonine phosphatase [Bacteroidales bacterium]
MRSRKNDIKFFPEVIQIIKSNELEMERLINGYRFFIITFLIVVAFSLLYHYGLFKPHFITVSIPSIVIVYAGMIGINVVTKRNKHIPLLKYITVLADYIVAFGVIYEVKNTVIDLIGITEQSYLILASIFLITINSFSALRAQIKVIVFSTIVGLFLNGAIHNLWGGQLFIAIYTGMFIIISGFLNVFISSFIFRSYFLNYRLSSTLKELEKANSEISSINDYLVDQNNQIATQKKQIISSIEYASRIQEAVLDTTEEIQAVAPENFILFKPRDIVSGDFYWFRKVEVFTKEYHVFAAVDCTGHGVPGAFMSMLGTSFLNEIVTEFYTELVASDILNRMREEIKKHLHQDDGSKMVKDGMDMALCAIDYETMELQFAGANNPLFLVRYENGAYYGDVTEIVPDKMPIGVHLKEKLSFTNHVITVNKGDMIYVFSDGYIDQFGGENGDKFKKKRFKELLLRVVNLPLSEQKRELERELELWMGDRYAQIDDITIIGVRV